MKCYSLILIFIFIFSSVLYAQEVPTEDQTPKIIIAPYKNIKLSNGDLTEVEIISIIDDNYFFSLKNKKASPFFYVVEPYKKDGKKILKVFVTNAVTSPIKETQKFKISERFEFNFEKERVSKEFQILERPFDIIKSQKVLYSVLIGLVLLIVALIYNYVVVPNRKRALYKKKFVKSANELIDRLKYPKSREDFECYYVFRKEIKNYLEYNNTEMRRLLREIDKIQFKKAWSENEYKRIVAFQSRLGELRVKDGV